jgi:putative endonuclease
MYYVYILKDDFDKIYTGYSSNLKSRLKSHLLGTTTTTSDFSNPKLIYYESYLSEDAARTREKKLKQYGSSYTGLLKRLGLK